ncbi:MAG: hypothetical protein R6X12_09025 [bacterium]
MTESHGVWADRDSLLVRTPGFGLIFERVAGLLSAALVRIESGETALVFETRALALFDPAASRAVLRAKDPEAGNDLVFDNDIEGELELGRVELDVAVTAEGIALGRGGRTVERLACDRLELILPSGRAAALVRLEQVEAGPKRPAAELADGVDRCLQAWALGTGIYRSPDGIFRSLTIGTNRFSFGFSYGAVEDTDILHVRAARVRATEAGTAFAPVARLFARGDRVAVAAAEDFTASAVPDFEPDPAGFDSGAGAPPAGELAPEWWRVTAVEPDGITLESRSGGRYRLARPAPGNPALVEWFRFGDYRAAGRRPQ